MMGFSGGTASEESACNAGNPSSIPGSGRSPRKGNGYPPQCSCQGITWMEEPGGLQPVESQRELDTTE